MIIVAVPELDALLSGQPALPPRLRAMLARGQSRALDESAWAAELVAGRAVAAAPLTRRLDAPEDAEGFWLRADPVVLTPDLSAVWIRPGARLDAGSPAVSELRDVLAEAGLAFDLPHPERGYIRLERLPECRFVPPAEVHGESMDYVLPAGPDAARWRRLLNECQVILHQQADAADPGRPGGLWFWGAGSLPPRDQIRPRVRHLSGADPLWSALAAWLGLEHAAEADAGPARDGSLIEWQPDPALDQGANLAALDEWLTPLWRRLRWGRLHALEIAGRRRVWRLSPAAAWCFWQRSATLPT
ncbi:hypothetical protein [Wenzhouxiangella limi]|uniref:Phosphoglycerate mutase n=1 Tax=Wenzhouxiangella limi TaxID=2707351 RepID=A0A845URG8_9GAMM|nr:hypothetical protein [Wenzhouxiangella limi]NDY94433.1 hypothetical protein [Wenzhouxiangella limi]